MPMPGAQAKGPAEAGGYGKQARQAWPSRHFEIFRRGLAVAAGHKFELDVLAFVEAGQTRAFNGRDVNEHILVVARRLDESVTLRRIEPFDGARLHRRSPELVED